MFALGALHEDESDLATDSESARHWFTEGALHGHPSAALMLARYSARGWGGPADVEVARRWYAYAASLGAPEATEELAELDLALAASSAPRMQLAIEESSSGGRKAGTWDLRRMEFD
jgi:TPR repeat protein